MDDHAQVKYSFVVRWEETLKTASLKLGQSAEERGEEGEGERRGRENRERRKKGGREGRGEREVEELEEGEEEGEQRKRGREMKPFCCKLLTTSAAYFILPPIGSV